MGEKSRQRIRRGLGAIAIGGTLSLAGFGTGWAGDKQLEGVTLTLASMNDQFAEGLIALVPAFEEATGAKLTVEVMDYGTLLSKTTADFSAHQGTYDLVTMDIVWAGQFSQKGYSVDLSSLIRRDEKELDLDDIYPGLMDALGRYGDRQVAYPFAGYAALLAYRKDLFDAAGLSPPTTMAQFSQAARTLTDPNKDQYGFVTNGKEGAPVAQDWMRYNAEMGGTLLDDAGRPILNSVTNIENLTQYRDLFLDAAPPKAIGYDWDESGRNFREGRVAILQTWSVGAPAYYDTAQSKIVDKVAITLAPREEGLTARYGIGGWGLAINADIDDDMKEAAWTFIKWVTSPEVHKSLNEMGAGSYIRRSEVFDPDLNAKYPFLPLLDTAFSNGDGDYRPRVPEYPELQEILGVAIHEVLAGREGPKEALDKAQSQAVQLF
jgi:multiple sugar transport system substrate-binding protein